MRNRNHFVDAGRVLASRARALGAVAGAVAPPPGPPDGEVLGPSSGNIGSGPAAGELAIEGAIVPSTGRAEFSLFGARETGRLTGANFGSVPCCAILYRPGWLLPPTKLLLTLSNFIRLIRFKSV